MADESTLAYALLGLLHGAPQSGYDLRKTFVATPMALFSDSPGAIYPALRRLLRRRWIAAAAPPRGGRRRRLFAPTEAGRKAFAEWLDRPPSREDVMRDWDVSMLRLAFMGAGSPEPVRRFLEAIQVQLRLQLRELEAFQAAHTPAMPLGAQLAFASGVEGCRAQVRWVEGALARMRKQRRTR
jgi:DNA-binding PadR family transcriptional regulator